MSINLMASVYKAHFPDVEFDDNGRKRRIVASSLKSVVLAMADHANDEGEGSYPSLTKLEDKTELSRHTVIAALKAAKHMSLATFAGVSKKGTNSYTLNKSLLEDMENWPKKQRKKGSEATSPASAASEAASPEVVKPLHQASEAASPEPSFNHPQPPSRGAASAPAQNINPNTGRNTAATVRGDKMDGMMAQAKEAERRGALQDKISDFPADCQMTLTWFVNRFNLPVASVPGRPGKKQRGGIYAQWINEIRAVNQMLEGTGTAGLEAAAKASEHLSISHPGALTWAIPAEVGKILKRKEQKQQPKKLTPFQEAMRRERAAAQSQPGA